MARISKHFMVWFFMGIIGVGCAYSIYKYTASQGLLGEKALRKYEQQTSGKGGVLGLLMSGRSEVFISLLACLDKPIVGFGPWPLDTNDYTGQFLRKFGSAEACEEHEKVLQFRAMRGRVRWIPCHSHITMLWCWYGIDGLIFCLYAIYLIFRYFRHDIAAVPQWFFWLAASAPSFLWALFFSPFAERIGVPLYLVALLVARAVRRGTMRLPPDMMKEIEKYGR